MSDADENNLPESEPQAPKQLATDLAALCGARPMVPKEVDDAVLAAARREIAGRARRRTVRWIASGAAAAVVLLGVAVSLLTVSVRRHASPGASAPRSIVHLEAPPVLAREDIDGDGRVDIRDAFALARGVESSEAAPAEWDLTGDGAVDKRDIDVVAYAAVRLDKGAM